MNSESRMTMSQPDYIYDPDDWECTYEYNDRNSMIEDIDLAVDDIKRFSTLVDGPDKFVARIVVTRDDHGGPDKTEIRWFDTEAEARDAIAKANTAEQP